MTSGLQATSIERDGHLVWTYSDGGRTEAGFKGETGDCVVRSIAIAADLPYREVYDALHQMTRSDKKYIQRLVNYGGPQYANRRASPREGILRRYYEPYLFGLGWVWTPTMKIGGGCKVHLTRDELPSGRLVVTVSKHLCAVIDGTVHDTHDPSRDGTRCVYGYYSIPSE